MLEAEKTVPSRILLATDFSPRSDRALDRAVSLAREWRAGLVVLHVLEEEPLRLSDISGTRTPPWGRPMEPAAYARERLAAHLSSVADRTEIIVERGEPVDAILRAAAARACDLIVTGVARDEWFGRFSLGKIVDRLLQRSQTPLLVVKDRPRGAYRHIAVATDFSESSRHALRAALRLFPHERPTLFHAYDAPLAGLTGDSATVRKEYQKVAEQDYAAFLNAMDLSADVFPPPVLVDHSAPELVLRDYVRDTGADLVVLGTHGRGAVFDIAIGNVAKRIMAMLPCDALVIREPRAVRA